MVSSAQNHLAPWQGHKPLARVRGRSDFRFEDLKDEVATVYLILPPEYPVVCRSFIRVMTGLAIASVTRSTRRPRQRGLILLEEEAAPGYIKALEKAIGYIVGYGVTLCGCSSRIWRSTAKRIGMALHRRQLRRASGVPRGGFGNRAAAARPARHGNGQGSLSSCRGCGRSSQQGAFLRLV